MRRLDEDFEACCNDESLLHIVCALGAKFLALDNQDQFSPESILTAGNQWAKVAKARLFVDLDDLSLEKLMTAILLYDHDLRIGSYASAFMLSGMTARMSQALQLNLESSSDILCNESDSSCAVTNESKRRLMWSCYVMDSWVGSGVNQLTLLEDKDLKIQLPCHSHNFSLGTACVTETLDEGKVLGFIPREQTPSRPAQNMGIEAYFIRLVSSRKKVLRYVKHLDTSKPPWEPDSEFLQLTTEFANWRRYLPQSLKWNPEAIYARKESSQLGALTLLWCTYYQTLCDLYRIGMPNLFRIRRHHVFPPVQQGFLEDCRKACFDNSRELSKIIAEASRHGMKALSDTWLCIVSHDSTKVMLYFLKLNTQSPNILSAFEVEETMALVEKNMKALKQMRSLVATAEHCYLSVVKMMIAAGLHPQLPHAPISEREPEANDQGSSTPGSPIQESPEAVLNPLAIYRMARTALHGKDSRASTSNSSSTTNTNSPRYLQSSTRHRSRQTPGQEQTQSLERSQIDDRTDMLPPFDPGSSPIRPDDTPFTFNTFPQFPPLGTVGSWDPSEMAIINMLDDRTTPWSAEYLTDVSDIGRNGPLHISRQVLLTETRFYRNALVQARTSKSQKLGKNIYNGKQEGLVPCISSIYNGVRYNSSVYLAGNGNVDIMTSTVATRITIENETAVSVTVVGPDHIEVTREAMKEIIIAAGVFETPKLLLLSGVGPRRELARHGIKPVIISEHVGEHLLDHTVLPHVLRLKDGMGLDHILLREGPPHDAAVEQYKKYQTGPLASGLLEMPVFCDVFQWHFPVRPEGDWLTVIVHLLHPQSKHGYVRLNSVDPREQPDISLNYFSDEMDILVWREGVLFVDDLFLNGDGMKDIILEDYPWPMPRDSNEEMDRMVFDRSQTGYREHAVCYNANRV
ncbi:uncharacterized protein N7511_002574 [Penicillium nucicola]|uniref:uncharacterized protein n=1 Tax=Penicillium nucicola TaxID=1850975 RepID=UPI002545710C|nr:uncharacterized protein N7511_002574 [Penicillium nucicola]KAJ5770523.1 hypothetical protein N7511_002574 [Penicillium nucicola]